MRPTTIKRLRILAKRIGWSIAALTALAVLALLTRHLPAVDRRPDIVLISMDTVRADHLSTYGYDRETSPNLTALAEDGVLFRNAISQAPWTLPSVATLHTSLYAAEHGADSATSRLSDAVETLAETLVREGYRTIGITTHMFVNATYGFAQGFDVFDETLVLGHDAVTAEAVTKRALDLLEANRRKPFFRRRPTLLWVHYFDPHSTYVRHPEYGFAAGYRGRLPAGITQEGLNAALQTAGDAPGLTREDLAYVEAVYDEEIAYTDHWIGELVSGVERYDTRNPTVYVVTADHGESFLERGRFFHGKDVYDPLIRVPLIVGGDIAEAQRGRLVERHVEIASVPRTIVELLGVEDHGFHGENLLAPAGGGRGPRPVFTEGSYAWGRDQRKQAVIHEGWKLIHNLDDHGYELYDLRADPGERTDLWRAEDVGAPPLRIFLKELLDRFPARHADDDFEVEISRENRRHLESLGYL